MIDEHPAVSLQAMSSLSRDLERSRMDDAVAVAAAAWNGLRLGPCSPFGFAIQDAAGSRLAMPRQSRWRRAQAAGVATASSAKGSISDLHLLSAFPRSPERAPAGNHMDDRAFYPDGPADGRSPTTRVARAVLRFPAGTTTAQAEAAIDQVTGTSTWAITSCTAEPISTRPARYGLVTRTTAQRTELSWRNR